MRISIRDALNQGIFSNAVIFKSDYASHQLYFYAVPAAVCAVECLMNHSVKFMVTSFKKNTIKTA